MYTLPFKTSKSAGVCACAPGWNANKNAKGEDNHHLRPAFPHRSSTTGQRSQDIPAESVYAVPESKQELDKELIEYAGAKAESVRLQALGSVPGIGYELFGS